MEKAVSGRIGICGEAGTKRTGCRSDQPMAEPADRRRVAASRKAVDEDQHHQVQGGLAAIAVWLAGTCHRSGAAGSKDVSRALTRRSSESETRAPAGLRWWR